MDYLKTIKYDTQFLKKLQRELEIEIENGDTSEITSICSAIAATGKRLFNYAYEYQHSN